MKEITKKDAGLALLKGAIGAIPYAGSALNEMLFELRSKVKQDRVNNFVNSFAEYIEKVSENELDLEQIKSNNFGDFFEELLINISKTNSEIKILAFRNLLLNQLMNKQEIDKAELLLNVVNSLNEKQIEILNGMEDSFESSCTEYKSEKLAQERRFESLESQMKEEYGFMKYEDIAADREFEELNREINKVNERIVFLKGKIAEIEKPFISRTYNVSESDFMYLKQGLISNGLLIDKGMQYSAEPMDLIEISELGLELLDFIKEYE